MAFTMEAVFMDGDVAVHGEVANPFHVDCETGAVQIDSRDGRIIVAEVTDDFEIRTYRIAIDQIGAWRLIEREV